MNNIEVPQYPLLEEMLKILGMPLKASYSNRDLALLFNVSVRSIQSRVAAGQLIPRDLPGRAKYLTGDIESFLAASLRPQLNAPQSVSRRSQLRAR
jgi:hypothetical protein